VAKILIVDDDKLNGQQIKLRLEKRDYNCDYVDSGEACLDALEKTSYDCILLDIMMPGISGLEVLKTIRKTKNNFELPVIMVTAKDEADDVVEALKLEANDYLTKPVNVDIAIARVNTQVSLRSLFNESLNVKQMQTINTMITTLNHEINNPLAIAIGNLTIMNSKEPSERVEKCLKALNRITDIVKKVQELVSENSINEVDYSNEINMFDLHDTKKKD